MQDCWNSDYMAQLDGGSFLGLIFWTCIFWICLGTVVCGWRGLIWNVVILEKGLVKLEVYQSKNRCRVDCRTGLSYMIYNYKYYEVKPNYKSYVWGMIGGVLVMLGFLGVMLNRMSIIRMLICVEVILVGLMLLCYVESVRFDDMLGIILGLMILGIAGGESAVGLGMLMRYNRGRDTSLSNKIKGWLLVV